LFFSAKRNGASVVAAAVPFNHHFAANGSEIRVHRPYKASAALPEMEANDSTQHPLAVATCLQTAYTQTKTSELESKDSNWPGGFT